MGAKDTVFSMEVVTGKFGMELVHADGHAVVFNVIIEVEVFSGLGDCQIVLPDMIIIIQGDVWNFDLVESSLNCSPVSSFKSFEDSDVC